VLRLLESTEEGIRRYDAKRHAQLAEAFAGHDPGVCALNVHAMGLSLRGLPDQARRTVERALLLARSLSHAPSIAHAHAIGGRTFMTIRDRHGCERTGAQTVALAEKFDLPGTRGFLRTSLEAGGFLARIAHSLGPLRVLPLVRPVLDGLGEDASAYRVGGSRFDGRGVSSDSGRATL
jgi:hypothetical protein